MGRSPIARASSARRSAPEAGCLPQSIQRRLQEDRRVEILEGRIGVRISVADVAQASRAQQRVGQGMQHHVGVAVSRQSARMIDGHAAQDERTAPDQPMRPGRVARDEFEYVRHGTTSLIGNFDVVTGEMLAPTIGPTRTEEDFVSHIEQAVDHDPEGEWVFIVDGLNIHWSAGLVEWVAQRCEPDRPRGKKRESRCPEMPGDTSQLPV